MEKLLNFINGEYCEPINGKFIDNYEPATGKVYSLIPDSDANDVEKAVEAAEKAFPVWSSMSIEERSAILVRLSEGIERRMDEFVAAESKDNGKPVTLAAHVDIPRAVSNFHFFATAILHYASESHYMEGLRYSNSSFCFRIALYGRCRGELHLAKTNRDCRMYFSLEFTIVSFFVENSPCISGGKLRNSEAI